MKILAVSDIHADAPFMQEMAKRGKEEGVDLVLIAGDILNFDEPASGLIGPFKEQGLEVGIIPGNHEGMGEINALVERYQIKNLHGYVMKKGDVGIFGCGYADVGPHTLTEEEFFSTLHQAHSQLGDVKKKVMVTHIHPSESVLGIGMWPGSTGVRKAIDEFKPDVHICGHIHETHGIEEKIGETKVINVGKTGRIIEL